MGAFNLLPVSDSHNTGWTLVNASTLATAWDDDDDTTYAKAPGYPGHAEVSFPQDTLSVPEGAVVDSITVYLRANLTTTPGPLTIVTATTVTLRSTDDAAKELKRTVYPDNAISTIEVGTFNTDATGQAWDVHRLNKLRLGAYVIPRGVTDAIRVYKLYVAVNYHIRPVTTVVSPSGVSNSSSPTVQWSYSHAEAESEELTEWKVFTQTQTQALAFDPALDTPLDSGTTQAGVTSGILFDSLSPGVYSIYMRGKSIYGAYALWAGSEFTIYGPHPGIPGGDDNSGPYGADVIGVVADSPESCAHLTLRDSSNLLSVQQADFDYPNDPLRFIMGAGTAERDTVNVYTQGSGSLKLTSSAAGGTMTALSSEIEVAAGSPFTVRFQSRADTVARTVDVVITFSDATFTSVGGSVTEQITNSTTTWKELVATGTVPEGAVYATLNIRHFSVPTGEIHFIDRLGFMYGTDTPWSSGGHFSRNLLSSLQASAERAVSTDTTVRFSAANPATTVSLVAAAGSGADGSYSYQMTYTGVSPSIAIRGTAGTAFTSSVAGNTITINKPAAAVEDDLLVAYVGTNVETFITIPDGWNRVAVSSVPGEGNQLAVFSRTVGAADPASWDFYSNTQYTRCTAQVSAYSGTADASEQFTVSGTRTDADGNEVHQTASVTNTVSNAWRISAFCTMADGLRPNSNTNATAPTIPPPPMFVGKGTIWKETNPSTSWVITRPSGVQEGDLMLAAVASPGGTTFTAPAGWTLVQSHIMPPDLAAYGVTRDLRMSIFKRTAGASEPSSWTGVASSAGYPYISTSVAWRYCLDAASQFLTEGTSHHIAHSTGATNTHGPAITSTSNKAARVHFFSTIGEFGSVSTATSSEDFKREGTHVYSPTANVNGTEVAMNSFDSGDSPVSEGSHQKVMAAELSYQVGLVFSGIIYGITAVPAPGADETLRASAAASAGGDPIMSMHAYDSNAVITPGSTSVYATRNDPSYSTTSWIGILKPATPSVSGYVSAELTDMVDISNVNSLVKTMADNKITVVGSFLGSTVGTPYLTAEFYRANQLISSATAEGEVFGTSRFTKSAATFDLPENTTHVRMAVSASDRAVSDTVTFDRLSIAFGESTAWRDGTGSPAHPIWAYPEIEFSENSGTGYSEWVTLPGLKLNPPEYDPLSGQVAFVDHTIVPLVPRKYRARMVTEGLQGDKFVSSYGPASDPVTVVAQHWWLKDISDPSKNVPLHVKWGPTTITTTNNSKAFVALGERVATVVGDGDQGDTFSLTMIANQEEFALLKEMVSTNRTLFLQSDVDNSWWVRKVGALEVENIASSQRRTNPLRWVTMNYVQVREED